MKIEASIAAAGLGRALDRHAHANEEVQRAFSEAPPPARDRIRLSDLALDHEPDAEAAVTESIAASSAVEAAAAAARAEEERQQALMFVLAHHGGPLR